jgi:hypothetical protein
MLLTGIGLILPVWGVFRIVVGIRRKNKRIVFVSILVPVLYWWFYMALWEADRRFIESETEKNGGELPEWVW